MFGKMGDMLGKLKEMKQKADEIKIKLDNTLLNIDGASGDIKIKITGNREIISVTITDALQHGNKIELEKQLQLAINKALKKANEVNEIEMKEVASGMLPGLG